MWFFSLFFMCTSCHRLMFGFNATNYAIVVYEWCLFVSLLDVVPCFLSIQGALDLDVWLRSIRKATLSFLLRTAPILQACTALALAI